MQGRCCDQHKRPPPKFQGEVYLHQSTLSMHFQMAFMRCSFNFFSMLIMHPSIGRRGTTLAEFLIDVDPQGKLQKCVSELLQFDPKGLDDLPEERGSSIHVLSWTQNFVETRSLCQQQGSSRSTSGCHLFHVMFHFSLEDLLQIVLHGLSLS